MKKLELACLFQRTCRVYLVYNILAGGATFFFAFTAALIVLRLGINVRKHRQASERAEDHAMFASKERTKSMRVIEVQLYMVSLVIGAFAFVSTLFVILHSIGTFVTLFFVLYSIETFVLTLFAILHSMGKWKIWKS